MDSNFVQNDYLTGKRQIANRLQYNWESIIEKYDRPHENDAVIDLDNLEIVHNKGYVEQMPIKNLGYTVFACKKRERRKKSKKGHQQWKKYASIDSALGSISAGDTSNYPPLDALDFTHANLDDTGPVCIRYQYDQEKDLQPVMSGPQDLIRKTASFSGSDASKSEDEDNTSVESGRVDRRDSFSSLDLQDNISGYDSADDTANEEVIKQYKGSFKKQNELRKSNSGCGRIIQDKFTNEESETNSSPSDSIPSILEAKINFVNRVHRLVMYPVEGGMAWESDGYLAENETATTVSSDMDAPEIIRKQGVNDLTIQKSVSVSQVPNYDKNCREISLKCDKSDVRPRSVDMNDYSTILAGNLDLNDVSIHNEHGTKDFSDDEVSMDEDNKTIRNPDNWVCLNRTIGGGLELPQSGTAKHIVIGNVPLACDTPRKLFKGSQRRFHQPDGKIHQPDVRNNNIFVTSKSKCYSKSQTRRSPQTPISPYVLKPNDTLQIFQSPLPITSKSVQAQIFQFSGRHHQGKTPPTSSKSNFKTASTTSKIYSPRTLSTHFDETKSSPLQKTLKKMQADVTDKKTVKEGPFDGEKSELCSLFIQANKNMNDKNLTHKTKHLNTLETPLSDDDDCICDQHDTYEFHNSTMSECDTETLKSQNKEDDNHLASADGLNVELGKWKKKTRSTEKSSHTGKCFNDNNMIRSLCKQTEVQGLSKNTSNVDRSVSSKRPYKRALNKASEEHSPDDPCPDDNVNLIAKCHKNELTPRTKMHASANKCHMKTKVFRESYEDSCDQSVTTLKVKTIAAVCTVVSPSCLTSPLNHLSLQNLSSVQGGLGQNALQTTPNSTKTTQRLKNLVRYCNGGMRHRVKQKHHTTGESHHSSALRRQNMPIDDMASNSKFNSGSPKADLGSNSKFNSQRSKADLISDTVRPKTELISDNMFSTVKPPNVLSLSVSITKGSSPVNHRSVQKLSDSEQGDQEKNTLQKSSTSAKTIQGFKKVLSYSDRGLQQKVKLKHQSTGLSHHSSALGKHNMPLDDLTSHSKFKSERPKADLVNKSKSNSEKPITELINNNKFSADKPCNGLSPSFKTTAGKSNEDSMNCIQKHNIKVKHKTKCKQSGLKAESESRPFEYKLPVKTPRCTDNTKCVSKFKPKCASPSRQVIKEDLVKKDVMELQCHAARKPISSSQTTSLGHRKDQHHHSVTTLIQKVPSSPERTRPNQIKKQQNVSLVTSTPIKNVNPIYATVKKSAPGTSKNETVLARLSQKVVSNKLKLSSHDVLQKTRHSPQNAKHRENLKKIDDQGTSRLHKRATKLSRKHAEFSSDTDDYPSSSYSCETDSITENSSDTYLENTSFNTTLSSASIICDGPGRCTKMFCFTCAGSTF